MKSSKKTTTELTSDEKKLAAHLLEMASETYARHGCNDFNLSKVIPDRDKRRKLIKEYHDYNGDPDEFIDAGNFEWFFDFALMSYMAEKVKRS